MFQNSVIDKYRDKCICYSATIELCNTCNWECEHCYIPVHKNKGLSFKNVVNILEQLRKMGVFEIAFTGGEIFTRNDTLDIIMYARKLGFAVTLLTNCSLITERDIEVLEKINVKRIETTIFSMNDEIHDRFVHCKGGLKNTIHAIEKMKLRKFEIKVKTIVMQFNFNECQQIKEYCDKNHFEFLITPDVYIKNNGDEFPLRLRLNESQLKKYYYQYCNNGGYVYKDDNLDSFVCKSTRYSLFIDCNGNIQPCGNYKFILGSYTDGIQKIWDESDELDIIQNIKYRDVEKCLMCKLIPNCSVCFGIIQNYKSDLKKYVPLDTDCAIANIRKRIGKEGENEKI